MADCDSRARGETETAREVSMRGDMPFERPARRISRDPSSPLKSARLRDS